MHYTEVINLLRSSEANLQLYPLKSFYAGQDEFFQPEVEMSIPMPRIEASTDKPNLYFKSFITGKVNLPSGVHGCSKWYTMNMIKEGEFNSKGMHIKALGEQHGSILAKLGEHFDIKAMGDGEFTIDLTGIEMYTPNPLHSSMIYVAQIYVGYLKAKSLDKVYTSYYDMWFKTSFPKTDIYSSHPDKVDEFKEHHINSNNVYAEPSSYKPLKPAITLSLKGSSKIDSLNACIKRIGSGLGKTGTNIFMYDEVLKIENMKMDEKKDYVGGMVTSHNMVFDAAKKAYQDFIYESIITASVPDDEVGRIKDPSSKEVHTVSISINR